MLVSDSATSVVVMDAAARTEITRFDLAPNALLVRPDGAVAYAALRGDDRVAVIDLETLEVVDEFETGGRFRARLHVLAGRRMTMHGAMVGSGKVGARIRVAGRAVVSRAAGEAPATEPEVAEAPAEEPAAAAGALADALTFHASFDNGLDADRAAADPVLYTAPSYDEQDQAEPGLGNPAVMLAEDFGTFRSRAALHRAQPARHLLSRGGGTSAMPRRAGAGPSRSGSAWIPPPTSSRVSATRSQITDAAYNDAAIWVDFTAENPRQFRLGVFGDLDVWNPDGLGPNDNPAFTDRLTVVDEPPFAGDRWTHVAITYAGLGQTGGAATLYLDGERVPGGADDIDEPFTWDVERGAIRLGVNYVGLFDELSLFDRPLTDDEVRALHALDGGVAGLSTD